MADIIRIHKSQLSTRLMGVARWKVSAQTRKEVLQFIEELELGKVNRGKQISERRRTKYLDLLRIPLEFFEKPVEHLTEGDIERFEKRLTSDSIQSARKNSPYSHATKVDIRKALKIFLRWKLGEVDALRLAGWLDIRYREKTPDYLKESEVQALFSKCQTTEQRYIVAVLFDSGARAEEFMNLRFEDVHLPEGYDPFVKLTLKEEYSKTKGRTISLYWRHSLDAVKALLQNRIAQGIKPQEPVFTGTYDSMRVFLTRLGQEALKRAVHPHLFRHTSATYHATRLNRQELCYRYGWRFSSNMPDVYISRTGMETKALDVKFAQTELNQIKDEVIRLRQEMAIKGERLKQVESDLATIRQQFPAVAEVMKIMPSIDEIRQAIGKVRQMSNVNQV